MAKKKARKTKKHESFKITAPKPTYNKLFFYMVISLMVGIVIGIYFEDFISTSLASYTPAP